MTQEPILEENPDRFVIFPLQYPELFSHYKTFEASMWTYEDIDLSTLKRVPKGLKDKISSKFASFLHKYATLSEQLMTTISEKIQVSEVRFFYGFKLTSDNVHREALCRLLSEKLGEEEKNLTEAYDSAGSSEKNRRRRELAEKHLSFEDIAESEFGTAFTKALLLETMMFSSEMFALFALDEEMGKAEVLALRDLLRRISLDRYLTEDFGALIANKYLVNKMEKDELERIILEVTEVECMGADDRVSNCVKRTANYLAKKLGVERNVFSNVSMKDKLFDRVLARNQDEKGKLNVENTNGLKLEEDVGEELEFDEDF